MEIGGVGVGKYAWLKGCMQRLGRKFLYSLYASVIWYCPKQAKRWNIVTDGPPPSSYPSNRSTGSCLVLTIKFDHFKLVVWPMGGALWYKKVYLHSLPG